jgi:hypothetical protein
MESMVRGPLKVMKSGRKKYVVLRFTPLLDIDMMMMMMMRRRRRRRIVLLVEYFARGLN